jgi:hypothetical protein
MLRDGGSFVVAILLIIAGIVYVRLTERSIEQRIRQDLRKAKAEGKLRPEIDPEAAELMDIGVPVTTSEMRRIEVAHLLSAWRFVLIPLALIGSLALARLFHRRRP